MDIVMIILAILNLCGVVSGTAVSIYGIVFVCAMTLDAILFEQR